MKKIIFTFILLLSIFISGCSSQEAQTKIINSNSSLQLINETSDQNGNIIQQIFYDNETDEYILKEYTYSLQGTTFVCTKQHTQIIPKNKFSNKENIDYTLKIYYNTDLLNDSIILIDNEQVELSVVRYLSKDYWWEFGYEVKIVNKTDKVLTTMISGASIMNIDCDPLFPVEHVAGGKTTYFTLAWDKATIEQKYIPYIDNIEFILKIYINDNWKTPALTGARVIFKNS